MLRRQLLAMILGIELMINAANLALVYYAIRYQDARALAVALLVVAMAAAEVVVGVSLILALNRRNGITETEEARTLAG
jgi:NADH-quinone oxidoreductase subunit K